MKEFDGLDPSTFMAGWFIDPQVCNDIVTASNSNLSLFKQGVREYTFVGINDLNDNLFNAYCESLFKVIEAYRDKYPLCWKDLQPWGITNPIIQRYEPGKWYHLPHCENDGYSKDHLLRHLVFMTYLNTIDEGGGTEFIHQNIVTPAIEGLTLVWPATWTHYHKGVVAPNDTKYIITGWCTFADPSL